MQADECSLFFAAGVVEEPNAAIVIDALNLAWREIRRRAHQRLICIMMANE